MANQIQVSILMPMRNAADFVQETLRTLLAEREIALEIVIVDDLSTDASVQQVQALQDVRVRILQGAGQGISAALNLALAAAQGAVIMRCDADDLYPQGRIKAQYEWLQAHPEYDAVCGGFSTIDAKGVPIAEMVTGDQALEISSELQAGKTRTHFCTFAVRAARLLALGGFRPYFVTAEDIDMSLRLGHAAKVMYLPVQCYQYRLHGSSITHNQANAKRIFYEDTARLFQAQRLQYGDDDLSLGKPPSPPQAEDGANQAYAHVQNLLLAAAWQAHAKGEKAHALGLAWRSFKADPQRFNYRSALALLFKPSKN